MPALQNPGQHSWGVILLSVYGLILRIYMDFAGYTDIAIGVGRLFGFRLSENFNRPLIQKNIALYWRNWHITVYLWIRDYVFFPFFGYRATMFKMYAGMFLTVWLFMIWHGATPGFFLAGCYHGIGIVIWQLFQEIKRKRPLLRKIMNMKAVQVLSIGLTFNFVALGVPLYSFDKAGILNIFGKLFFSHM
jgi:D-alanyl-lipoteichoic acid acyltransferase DltB (MBOAT superfamily)